MTEDVNQPAEDSGKGHGLWRVWRWVIAVAVVVMLVFALRMAGSRDEAPVPQSAASAGAVQLSLQHYQAGRYQDAIAAAQTAIAANPDSAEAYNNLAVSYLGLSRYDEGIQAAQDAIRLRPGFRLALNNLAWIQQEKAKAAGPPVQSTPAGILLDQSVQHYQAGRFKECMDTATQAANLNSNSARAFNNIGICAGNLKLWDEAIRNTQEAIRLDPSLQLARNNLVWMQQERLKAGTATVQ